MVLSVVITTIFAITAFAGVLINLIVLAALIYSRLTAHRFESAAVFVITASELIADSFLLGFFLGILVPTCYAQVSSPKRVHRSPSFSQNNYCV
ncbi:unnamed protein product [Anisakis simplex]|uniref:G_PROTEIN_RECEP_F1_2 domain-containing protein n=1 Tax=Anisakis simplex TaxID=6269 RepID=A0A0M3KD97_ANISI|nr:unnamed protein product [Anisakis simplex]